LSTFRTLIAKKLLGQTNPDVVAYAFASTGHSLPLVKFLGGITP